MLVSDTCHQNISVIMNIQNKVGESLYICSSCIFSNPSPHIGFGLNISNRIQKTAIELIAKTLHLVIVEIYCILQLEFGWRKQNHAHLPIPGEKRSSGIP